METVMEPFWRTVYYAKAHSAFYREHLAAANGCTLAAFQSLPFTTAADLTKSGARMVCVSQEELVHAITLRTSGTSEAPKKLYFTQVELEQTVQFFLHGLRCMGLTREDTLLILFSCRRAGSVGDLLSQAGRRLGARVLPVGNVGDYREAALLLAQQRGTCVLGNPTQVLALAEATRPFLPLPMKAVLLSADYAAKSLRRRIEMLWDCPLYEHYGMTEMGLGGGIFCAARQGYHMRESDLFLEIIDEHGRPLPDGKSGELVFTTLTRTGMPLIRYRTGDRTRFLTTPCPCGSPLRLLERISGRIEQEGSPRISELDEALFAVERVIDYRAVLQGGRVFVTAYTLDGTGDLQRLTRAAAAVTAGVHCDFAPLTALTRAPAAKRKMEERTPDDNN